MNWARRLVKRQDLSHYLQPRQVFQTLFGWACLSGPTLEQRKPTYIYMDRSTFQFVTPHVIWTSFKLPKLTLKKLNANITTKINFRFLFKFLIHSNDKFSNIHMFKCFNSVLKLFTVEAFYEETINISKRCGTRNKYS